MRCWIAPIVKAFRTQSRRGRLSRPIQHVVVSDPHRRKVDPSPRRSLLQTDACGLPLAGNFTDGWRGKALATLDAGLPERVVASWGEGSGETIGFIGRIQHLEAGEGEVRVAAGRRPWAAKGGAARGQVDGRTGRRCQAIGEHGKNEGRWIREMGGQRTGGCAAFGEISHHLPKDAKHATLIRL